jgi:Ca2+-binding RTX toxin-like protein
MKAGVAKPAVRALAFALLTIALVAAPAAAKVFGGSSKANRVVGTKKGDVIRLGAGNDRARGRGGKDRIFGGRGRDRLHGNAGADRIKGGAGKDRLVGGKKKDRLAGGGGRDVLNAADGRRDAKVNGGKGRDRCRIDAADLAVVKSCATLKVVPRGGPGGGGPGDGGPGGGGSGSLSLTSAEGLECASSVPTCLFQLEGSGADAAVGTVTGVGGVAPGLGVSLNISGEDWSALGLYGCTSDGFLRVTIGTEHVDVPVDCTA